MEAFVTIVLIGLAAIVLYRVILYILKERYFASEEFLAHKKKAAVGRSGLARHLPAPKHIWRLFRTPAIGITAGTGT